MTKALGKRAETEALGADSSEQKPPGRRGLYLIGDLTNGKMYIGSSENVPRRVSQHFSDLRGERHSNIHLQRSFNLGHVFSVQPIYTDRETDIRGVERNLIEEFNRKDFLYNIALDTTAPTLGTKWTEEQRAKILA
ncbi:GIY-YIG catalytic domain protein [Caballeronia arationis]|uniref:GIY-YIG nuclease family protein n=1 Tax=Caballeronia arationis TaxID=1777142 RepID=UPI00074CF36F|nr:GIY-YIG nuclease family protein [Caballeronia arationis]SAK59250.1 GIY-YIG catalytic domain protein [Caballeronia arationis]